MVFVGPTASKEAARTALFFVAYSLWAALYAVLADLTWPTPANNGKGAAAR